VILLQSSKKRTMKRKLLNSIMILTVILSAETRKVQEDESEYWMEYWAQARGLEVALVKAISWKESKIGVHKERIEPHLKTAKWYLRLLDPKEKAEPYSFFSMGDMQILYGIAKSLGYTGEPHGLLHPKENYQWGTLYLKTLCISEKNIDRAVSAYNQGKVVGKGGKIFKSKYIDENNNGIKDRFEKWKNQYYVNTVLNRYKRYGGKIDIRKEIK